MRSRRSTMGCTCAFALLPCPILTHPRRIFLLASPSLRLLRVAFSFGIWTFYYYSSIDKVDATMNSINEQRDIANEISEAISSTANLGLEIDEVRKIELGGRGCLISDGTHAWFVGGAQGRAWGTRAGGSKRATPGRRSCASAHPSGSEPCRSAASNGRGSRGCRAQGIASFTCNVVITFS